MFKEERDELKFDWSMIGNIGEGRPNLGNTMDVSVYTERCAHKKIRCRNRRHDILRGR